MVILIIRILLQLIDIKRGNEKTKLPITHAGYGTVVLGLTRVVVVLWDEFLAFDMPDKTVVRSHIPW
jgi:hypothetical protein